MPIKKVNACDDCLGAISSVTSTEACDTEQCENVEVIDEIAASVYLWLNIHKLGTIYPPDVWGYPPISVPFNFTATIPSDICSRFSLSPGKNKVRFYIQISAIHWGVWTWNISYQPAYIVCPPSFPSQPQPSPPSPPSWIPPPGYHQGLPPVAKLITPEIARENTNITLDASQSYDPDGKIIRYDWGWKWEKEWREEFPTDTFWVDEVFGKPEVPAFSSSSFASLKIPYLPIEPRLLPPEAFDYSPDQFLIPDWLDVWDLNKHPEYFSQYIQPLSQLLPPKSLTPYLPSGLVEKFKEVIKKKTEILQKWRSEEALRELKSITGYFADLKWKYFHQWNQPPFPFHPSSTPGDPLDLENIEEFIDQYKEDKTKEWINYCGRELKPLVDVIDNHYLYTRAYARVTVLPFNLPPIAIIASLQKEIETPYGKIKVFGGYENDIITLNGSYSFDPDGDSIIKYEWKVEELGRSMKNVKILNPGKNVVQIKLPQVLNQKGAFEVCLRVWDEKNFPSPYECVKLWVYKKQTVTVTLTSDLTKDWIWQTKPLTLTWDSENASQCRRWIEIWNPFENVKLKDTSLGDKIPYDNWTSDWNDETSGTITTYPGSGPPDPQTGSQPRNWIGKLWIYKVECEASGITKTAEFQINVKPRPIWQEVVPF